MRPRHITVTGGAGFVGHRLVARLHSLGHTVQSLNHRSEIDVTDARAVDEAVTSTEVIIHLAARVFVPDSFRDPGAFYRTNVLGTINMLEVARRTGARFILASAYVYGRPPCLPIREDHPMVAHCPYAETKIIAERIFQNHHRTFGVSGTILRPFNIYGPGQDARFLIPTLLAQSKGGKLVLQTSRPKRDFVYVDDIVEGFVKAVDCEEPTLEVFNLASGRCWSVGEVVDLFRSLHGRPLSIEYAEKERPDEIEDTRADISQAKARLGWTPTVDLPEGLRRTMEAFFAR